MKKSINLELDRPEESAEVLRAIVSSERLKILKCLMSSSPVLNVSELEEKFGMPITTASLYVRTLEKRGLFTLRK
jgi:predicted transcriptional regulator